MKNALRDTMGEIISTSSPFNKLYSVDRASLEDILHMEGITRAKPPSFAQALRAYLAMLNISPNEFSRMVGLTPDSNTIRRFMTETKDDLPHLNYKNLLKISGMDNREEMAKRTGRIPLLLYDSETGDLQLRTSGGDAKDAGEYLMEESRLRRGHRNLIAQQKYIVDIIIEYNLAKKMRKKEQYDEAQTARIPRPTFGTGLQMAKLSSYAIQNGLVPVYLAAPLTNEELSANRKTLSAHLQKLAYQRR